MSSMLLAFYRLLILSGAVLLCGGLILFFLRYLGEHQLPEQYHHPLFKQNFWLVAQAGVSGHLNPNSPQAFAETSKIHPQIFLEADIEYSQQGWRLLKQNDFLLKDFLILYKHRNLILDIHHKETDHLDQLIQTISANEPKDKLIINSVYPKPLRYLRKKQPMWLYGLSSIDTLKMKIFISLMLEKLSPFNGDVAIAHVNGFGPKPKRGSNRVGLKFVQEVQRREKAFIVHINSPHKNQFLPRIRNEFKGIMTNRPSQFLSLLED